MARRTAARRTSYEQESKTWALFTNNSFRFTDALELTVGLRYTDESKDLDTHYVNQHGGVGLQAILRNHASAPPFLASPAARRRSYGIGCATYADPIFNNLATAQTIDENEWSGTAKLAYRFTDDVMAYVSVCARLQGRRLQPGPRAHGQLGAQSRDAGGIAADWTPASTRSSSTRTRSA